MPATAVGKAKGRSTSESNRRLPGKLYRTSTHATRTPNTRLIRAPISDAPKVRRYEATARGDAAMCQNCAQLSDDAFKKVAANGIRTIRLRYNTVNPSASPKPGRLLRFLNVK